MCTLISVENLSRQYGDFFAVDNISFCLKAGDIVGFLGPNGAGKSSTMNMLSGNLAPSHGEIQLNGFDLLSQAKQAKAGLGYLAETPPLYPALTVYEFLHYCAELRLMTKSKIKVACDNAIEQCGLSHVTTKLISTLSKGYKQRVGIAQAIIHSPSVIILDEPTVGLDPLQMQEIRLLIKNLGKTHGVILCTHILPEVQAVCNQVKIINHGKLVYNAPLNTSDNNDNVFEMIVSQKISQQTLEQHPIFSTLKSVTNNKTSAHKFIVQSRKNATQLIQYITQQNWGLSHFCEHENSLEKIFIDVTTNESTK